MVSRRAVADAAVAIAAMSGGYRHLEKAVQVGALLSIGRKVLREARRALGLGKVRSPAAGAGVSMVSYGEAGGL
jgi:hypothetical protein